MTWIRGEAFHTLLALRGLKEGDEVLVIPDPAIVMPGYEGWPKEEERLTRVRIKEDVEMVNCRCGGEACRSIWYPWKRQYITAWKAPEPNKEEL
jgi:hypothetical protein